MDPWAGPVGVRGVRGMEQVEVGPERVLGFG